jgi:hypothetical protein
MDTTKVVTGIVLLVVALAFSTSGLVDAQATNETETDDLTRSDVVGLEERSGPPLEELKDGGTPLPDAPPGIRSDNERLWWVTHWPADAILGSPGTHDDSYEERVDSTTTVSRTSVYLRTVSVEDTERTETVKVAFWRLEEREVEVGNTTRTIEVATDVEVEEHEVSYRAGMPIMEIPLGTTDEPRRVTMWIEGSDGPRWTFKHNPVAVSESIAVDSVGDFWALAGLYIVLPAIGGIAGGGVIGKRAISRTGKGPGYPIGAWLVGILLLLGVLALFAFSSVAELIGSLPYVVGGFVAVVGLIVILESQAVRERDVEFIKPEINSVGGPNGSKAVEALDVERRSETVVDLPSGDPAVVRSGVRPFIARAFGAAATIPSLAFDTRIDVSDRTESSQKSVDELIVVDPASSSVLEYESEGFEIDPPETRDELVRVVGVGVVAGLGLAALGMYTSWLWAVLGGAIVGAALLCSPVDGTADVDPAKAHVRSAWISSMLLSRDVEDAKTLEDARETIISQQGRGQREIQEAIEDQDATLVEEMLGTEVSRTLRDGDGPDVFKEELNDGSTASEGDDDQDDEGGDRNE